MAKVLLSSPQETSYLQSSLAYVKVCLLILCNILDGSSGKVSLSDNSITFLPALVLGMDGHMRTLDLHQNVIHYILIAGWCRTNSVPVPEFLALAERPSSPHPTSFAAQVLRTVHFLFPGPTLSFVI